MFFYDQKDASSNDNLKSSSPSGSVYSSSSFSRATTPVTYNYTTPNTTAINTPIHLKDMEINPNFQFGAGSSPQTANSNSSVSPSHSISDSGSLLPPAPINSDMLDNSNLDESVNNNSSNSNQSPPNFRSVSPFHLTTSIWDSPPTSSSAHKSQDSASSFMLTGANTLKNLDINNNNGARSTSLPKTLSIDINQANTNLPKIGVANNRSLSIANDALMNNNNRKNSSSANDNIWGTSFTPSSEFFGKSITSNETLVNDLNQGMNFLNFKPDQQQQQHQLQSPLLNQFNHKYTYSTTGINNAAIPRSSNGIFEVPANQQFQPQQLSTSTMNQIVNYFSRPEECQISQLSLDSLKNLNYEKIFANKVGQLPRFLLPGQNELNDGNNMFNNQQYQLVLVSFRQGRMDVFYHPLSAANKFVSLKNGELVLVEADRGKDLGMIINTDISIDDARLIKMIQFEEQTDALRFDQDVNNSNNLNGSNSTPAQPHIPKQVLKIALPHEIAQIPHKQSDELKALAIMQSKIIIHKIPMKVLGAEYQWDRRKLTFYYVANKRIDFRELVKDIFRIYKTRIWMCAVTPTDLSIKESIVDESNCYPQNYQFPPINPQNPSNIQSSNPPQLTQPIRHETFDSISSVNSDLMNNNYSYTTMNFHNQQPSFGSVPFTPNSANFNINNNNSNNGHQRQFTSGLANIWNNV